MGEGEKLKKINCSGEPLLKQIFQQDRPVYRVALQTKNILPNMTKML